MTDDAKPKSEGRTKTNSLLFRFDDDLKDDLENIAERTGETMTGLLTRLVKQEARDPRNQPSSLVRGYVAPVDSIPVSAIQELIAQARDRDVRRRYRDVE